METLQYETVTHMLEDLAAVNQGRYFLCKCPNCSRQEAFIYKNNINSITCNRQNHCGFSGKIEYEKETVFDQSFSKKRVSTLTKEKQEQLDIFSRYIRFLQHNAEIQFLHDESEHEETTYRGLSKITTKPFILDVKKEPFVKYLYTRFNQLFKPEYVNNSYMTKRNILIPIFGDDGMIDRLLLRSSIDHRENKKEIQLLFNDRENSKNHFSDIDNETNIIVIAESTLDALSFRELDKSVGVIGLIGNKVTGQVLDKLNEDRSFYKDKHIVLAFDNDKAGKETENVFIEELNKLQLSYSVFPFPHQIKDPNQFLQEDRKLFEEIYEDFKNEKGLINESEPRKKLFGKADLEYEEINLSELPEELLQEKLNNEEELNKMNVKINHMTLIKDKHDQEFGLAAVQYGDLTLNNLVVREVKGTPMVNPPSIKTKENEYYDVYSFNERAPYNHDKRMIEGALIKSFYELKHGVKDKIKNQEIHLTVGDSYDPKVLRSFEFENGNKSLNIAYKNVVVNNVIVGRTTDGKVYVNFPYYKNNNSEFRNYVTANKVFRDQVSGLSGISNEKNKVYKNNRNKQEYER